MVFCFSALINISFPFVLIGLVGGSCLEAFPTSKQDNAAVLPEVVPRWNSLLITQEEGENLTLKPSLWPDWTLTDKFMLLFTAVCQQEHTLWQHYETLSAAHLCASTCSPLCTVCKCCECKDCSCWSRDILFPLSLALSYMLLVSLFRKSSLQFDLWPLPTVLTSVSTAGAGVCCWPLTCKWTLVSLCSPITDGAGVVAAVSLLVFSEWDWICVMCDHRSAVFLL